MSQLLASGGQNIGVSEAHIGLQEFMYWLPYALHTAPLPMRRSLRTPSSPEQKGSNMYEKFSTQGEGVVTGSCRHPLPSTENPRLQERSFLLFPGIPALVVRLFSAVQRGDEKGRDFPREPTSQFYSCLWVLMGDGLYQKTM